MSDPLLLPLRGIEPMGAGFTIEERFERFHAMNPHVYALLAREARKLTAVGHRKLGVKMLFERLRWLYAVQTVGDHYRLNNDFTSHYSRALMEQERDLTGIFDTRELRAA